MQIGINLKEDEFEVTDSDDIVCNYPDGVEVGYLKINPERIPVIVGEKIAEEAIARKKYTKIAIDGGDYVLFADEKSVLYCKDFIEICGTAYIAKKQGGTHTALTADEIDDWIYDFEDEEMFEGYFPEDYPKSVGIRIWL